VRLPSSVRAMTLKCGPHRPRGGCAALKTGPRLFKNPEKKKTFLVFTGGETARAPEHDTEKRKNDERPAPEPQNNAGAYLLAALNAGSVGAAKTPHLGLSRCMAW
jgi:hypothetical protein